MCQEAFGGLGWVHKLGWLTDASITLAAFTGTYPPSAANGNMKRQADQIMTANPSLSALFSSHHGLVHIHSLPAPHTLLPPSDKFSTLRGLTSSGENNLAFKCMRKRLIFETLHLDVEGGVGERRTKPSTTTLPTEAVVHDHDHSSTNGGPSVAAVQIQLEQTRIVPSTVVRPAPAPIASADKSDGSVKKAKVKKKVAFTSERPDLYDF